jgi:hypothetical protein
MKQSRSLLRQLNATIKGRHNYSLNASGYSAAFIRRTWTLGSLLPAASIRALDRRVDSRNLMEEKMKKITLTYCFVALALFPIHLFAQSGNSGATGGSQPAERMQVDTRVTGGIVTLYALDPLARAFCFADGRDGMIFQNNEVKNRCSDIDFNSYNASSLTVGIEGGRVGRIIDLGNPTELRQRYGYEETVGNGQGFASLRVEDGKLVILRDRRSQAVQDLKESALLFQEGTSGANAPIILGHIYLVRLTDRNDRTFQRIVKLMVNTYTPNESVTIRWQIL